jgi:tetratricopeptide (TPR) repeat protein
LTMDELEFYQQMMSKDPSSQVFVYLAEALLEHGMYKEAIATCANGLRLRPHDLRARVILGVSFLRTGELDRAESELLKAKEMLEINAVTYLSLAELYEKKGDFDLAERYRRLFEAIHPTGAEEVLTEKEKTESEMVVAEVQPEKTEASTITMAQFDEEQGHLRETADLYGEISDASPEEEDVEDTPSDLERHVGEGDAKRNLLSILELWRKNLQDRIGADRVMESFGASEIDPEKMVSFIKKHFKGSHPS